MFLCVALNLAVTASMPPMAHQNVRFTRLPLLPPGGAAGVEPELPHPVSARPAAAMTDATTGIERLAIVFSFDEWAACAVRHIESAAGRVRQGKVAQTNTTEHLRLLMLLQASSSDGCVDFRTLSSGSRLVRLNARPCAPTGSLIRSKHRVVARCPRSYFAGATAVSGTWAREATSSSYATTARSSGTRTPRSAAASTSRIASTSVST